MRPHHLCFLAGCLVAALMLVTVGATVAGAQEPIGPRQHFIGLVNGSNNVPMVYTVCPGPASPGRLGPIAGGQTMLVAVVVHGSGFTGLFSQIYAWFVPSTTPPARPPALKFGTYRTPERIPASTWVAGAGTGKVEFSSCPYLAPCAAGWVPDFVHVRFVNIVA